MSDGRPEHSVRVAPLEEVLAFDYPWVVPKFRERYALSLCETQDIFQETKRWLWLIAYSQATPGAPKPLTIIGLNELTVVDEMWHTFVLFTEAYTQFCHRYFGRYLHHMPSTAEDHERVRREMQRDPEGFAHRQLAEFREQARFVGETLGAATVRKWFRTYGQAYSPQELDRLLIPRVPSQSTRVDQT